MLPPLPGVLATRCCCCSLDLCHTNCLLPPLVLVAAALMVVADAADVTSTLCQCWTFMCSALWVLFNTDNLSALPVSIDEDNPTLRTSD